MSPSGSTKVQRWRLRLLGGFELDDGQQRLRRLHSRAAMSLLARLAMQPQRDHPREELAALLWPEADAASGRSRLRQTLSLLRAVLEPPGAPLVLYADRRSLRLLPGALWCDVVAMEEAAAAGRRAEALLLYPGELLPGHYDEWIGDERRRLQALFERLAAAATAASGGVPVAAPQPRLGGGGDGAEWAHTPTPSQSPVSASRLPHYLTRLIGAESIAAQLRQRVLERPWVSLVGPGGVGKTRLAIEVAKSLCEAPAAGQAPAFQRAVFVPLLGVQGPEALLDAVAWALRLEAGSSVAEQFGDAVSGQRLLLLLDNGEQLEDAALAALLALVEQAPSVHWLFTSRRSLGLDGEAQLHLAPLPVPEAGLPLQALMHNPAVALYLDRARAHQPDVHLQAGNAAALVALLQRLDGLPLAIELAAARVRSVSPKQWLQLLDAAGGLGLLARRGPRSGADAREASMEAVVAWSWQGLSTDAQTLLARLCVLPAGATVPAAAALLDACSLAQAQRLLDELSDHSVLKIPVGQDEQTRHLPYQPVREYLLQRSSAADTTEARRRALMWMLDWVRAMPATPPLPEVREELPNVSTLLASAIADGHAAAALHLAVMLQNAWGEIALPMGVLQSLEELLAQAGLNDDHAANGHALLACAYQVVGQADAVRRHCAAALARPGADAGHQANTLSRVARMRWRVDKDAAGARELIEQALPLARQGQRPNTEGALLSLAAHLASVVDKDHAAARELSARSRALWAQSGNRHLINAGRYNAAVQASEAGQPAEVLDEFIALEAEGRALQDWDLASGALEARGTALLRLRRWAESAACQRESLAVAWAGMERLAAVYALWNLPPALARMRQGELAAFAMGCAEAQWQQRFGRFDASDARDIKRVRRFCRGLLGPGATAQAWQRGAQTAFGEAVRQILQATAPA